MEELLIEKECRLCEETKLIDNFNKSICGRFGYANECKDCRKEARKQLNYLRITKGIKLCNKCGLKKDVREFNSDCKNYDGLRSTCKNCSIECVYEYGSTFDGFIKMLYNDLKQNAKNRNIKVEITIDDIKRLYEKQTGLCALSMFRMTYNKQPNDSLTHINNKLNISVDRIDSSKNYIINNIQLVCAIVNIIKYNLNTDEFIDICKKISKHKGLI
jgi:hypothetical protein